MQARGATKALLIGGLLALSAGCDGGSASRFGEPNYDYEVADDIDARDEAADEARQEIYSERGADSDGSGADMASIDPYDVEDQGRYVCTDDCSGHEAGFAWAQENDIEDAGDCGGYSMSFIEGCEAFAQERQAAADMEAQEVAEQAAREAYENYEDEGFDEEDYEDGRMIDGQ